MPHECPLPPVSKILNGCQKGWLVFGSTAVGTRIYEAGGATMKRLLLELGGKGAALVLHDADVTKAVTALVSVWAFHSGQICTAPTRAVVHRSAYDRLIAGLQAAAPNLRVGPPEAEEGTRLQLKDG